MAKAKRKAPDRQQIERLVVEYRRTGDTGLRDQLISQHLYLVQTVARKFAGLGESHEDLLQEGAMGLINAVDLFDPERGVQFSTYATHLVEGQIRHYLRDRGKLIKQPAWVQELTTKIIKATDALTQELNRAPTLEEVAERVETSTSNIRRMLEARERSKVASLDSARADDDGQGPAVDPEKLRTDDSDDVHLPIEDKIFLRDAMSRLKTLERKVVHLFYYLDLNQTEIARRLGISVNYASYLLRRAVAKLKQAFEASQEQMWVDSRRDEEESRPTESYPPLSLRPAPTDEATELPTQRQFLDRLAQEVARATRYPQQFSLILTEPDSGDPGEREMMCLARLLRTNVRSIDLVARLSHARFGLLLPHTGREAGVLAERIVRTAAARLNGPDQALTVSTGYAVFPTNGRTTESLMSAVEEALAEARQGGGNCSVRAETPAPGRKEQPQRAAG
jgi:RNA polymerase sigma-B factor